MFLLSSRWGVDPSRAADYGGKRAERALRWDLRNRRSTSSPSPDRPNVPIVLRAPGGIPRFPDRPSLRGLKKYGVSHVRTTCAHLPRKLRHFSAHFAISSRDMSPRQGQLFFLKNRNYSSLYQTRDNSSVCSAPRSPLAPGRPDPGGFSRTAPYSEPGGHAPRGPTISL